MFLIPPHYQMPVLNWKEQRMLLIRVILIRRLPCYYVDGLVFFAHQSFKPQVSRIKRANKVCLVLQPAPT